MGPEINIDSILELEKQIEEGTGESIQLKRARNSLLNISTRAPPEILGHIFRWNVTPVGDFGRLVKGSYNFVLVCHHWFEVASSTPELWSFWGNTLNQWSKRYQHRGTAPIDVRLHKYYNGVDGGSNVHINGPLRDALRDRAERDSIRTLHLYTTNEELLRCYIFPPLIPSGQGIRCCSIESLILEDPAMDVSEFFTRRRFPKLRHLGLFAKTDISTWVHLESHMTALTTLSLVFGAPLTSPTPTIPQLLSIFASNPRLQRLSLSVPQNFKEYGEVSTIPIQLPHLKSLQVSGDFKPLLRLLHQIVHPEQMDEMSLDLTSCGVGDVSGILGPYLRYCTQRDGRFRDGLEIRVTSTERHISVEAAVASGVACPTLSPRHRPPFLVFKVLLAGNTCLEPFDKLWVDFVAHIPREHVVCLRVDMDLDAVKEIIPTMPNIRELALVYEEPSDGLLWPALDGLFASMKLIPSLRYLHMYDFDDTTWSSLLSYLVHQTSGGQVISLRIAGNPVHICPHLVERIRNVVEELILDLFLKGGCRFGVCSEVRGSDSAGCR